LNIFHMRNQLLNTKKSDKEFKFPEKNMSQNIKPLNTKLIMSHRFSMIKLQNMFQSIDSKTEWSIIQLKDKLFINLSNKYNKL
jgi:hypothetical protein